MSFRPQGGIWGWAERLHPRFLVAPLLGMTDHHDRSIHHNQLDAVLPSSGSSLLEVTLLTLFGSIAVTIMLLSYWQEARSKWMVLLFAGGSALTAAYSGLVAAYPITGVESLWALVALRRFWLRHRREELAVGQGL